MKGQAIVLKPGETMATAERFAFDKPADLEFLSKAVGGPIEVVPRFDHIQVLDGPAPGASAASSSAMKRASWKVCR